jgi:hypothetical protein
LIAVRNLRSHVIDLELLDRLDIVVDQHLLAADDGDAALLARLQPTDADVSLNRAGEIDADIGFKM